MVRSTVALSCATSLTGVLPEIVIKLMSGRPLVGPGNLFRYLGAAELATDCWFEPTCLVSFALYALVHFTYWRLKKR